MPRKGPAPKRPLVNDPVYSSPLVTQLVNKVLKDGKRSTDAADAAEVLRTATAVGEAVRTARDLVNTPPNDLYPETFAARARELAEAAGLTVEVLDDAALAEAGFGGVLGVGQGSSRKPRLVRLHWAGGPRLTAARARRARRQGHHVRHRRHLDQARGEHGPHDVRHGRGGGRDRHDAARGHAARCRSRSPRRCRWPRTCRRPPRTAPATCCACTAAARSRCSTPTPRARLILADAIVRAGEDNPDYLIETSTLTGAQLVALGRARWGSWARTRSATGSPRWRRACGEDGWAMPLPEHIRADAGFPGGRPRQRHGPALGRDARGGHVPARVRARRPRVGPPRHRGPQLPHRQPRTATRPRAARACRCARCSRCSRTSPRTADAGRPRVSPWRGGAGSAAGRRGRACAAGSPRAARRTPGWRGGGRACAPRPDPRCAAGSTRRRPRRAAPSSPSRSCAARRTPRRPAWLRGQSRR